MDYTFLAALGTFVTALVIYVQLRTHNKQLFLQNYDSVTKNVGDSEMKQARKMILYDTPNYLMRELVTERIWLDDKETKILPDHLQQIMHSCTKIASRYERAAFILNQNPKLKHDFLTYHYNTIVRVYEKIHHLYLFWWYKKEYPLFIDLVKESLNFKKFNHWEEKRIRRFWYYLRYAYAECLILAFTSGLIVGFAVFVSYNQIIPF